MAKACPAENFQPPPRPATMATTSKATTAVPAIAETDKAPDGEWKNVKGRRNTNAPPPQKQDVPSPKQQRQTQAHPKDVQEQPNHGKQEKQKEPHKRKNSQRNSNKNRNKNNNKHRTSSSSKPTPRWRSKFLHLVPHH